LIITWESHFVAGGEGGEITVIMGVINAFPRNRPSYERKEKREKGRLISGFEYHKLGKYLAMSSSSLKKLGSEP
jgi:hypothetical protein